MSIALSRRRFLAGSAVLLLAPSKARAATTAGFHEVCRLESANGRLSPFLLEGKQLYAAGDRHAEAWDVAAQRLIWRSVLSGFDAVFRPRKAADKLLISGRGGLLVIESGNGVRLWSHAPENEEFSVPLIHQGHLFAGDGNVFRAFDLNNGQERWRVEIPLRIKIAYGPAAFGETILLAPGDGVLHAYAAADGRELWALDKGEEWQYLRQLHLSDDVLVAGGYHDEVWGIEAKSGRILWRFQSGNFVNSHLVQDGRVYFWSPTGWIYCLDARTGSVIWRHRTTDYRGTKGNWAPLMAELVLDAGRLFCLDMAPELHILEAVTGKETARLKLPALRHFVVPEPGGKRLWLANPKGEILGIELAA
jgi:hypothetical protein